MARANMLEIARWTKFISIVMFIGLGLGVLGAIAMMLGSSAFDNLGYGALGIGMGFFYLLMVALYFYPIYALYKFSELIKPAIRTANQQQFNDAFAYLKGHYKFFGILLIIVIALYGLVFIFAGIGAAVSGL